MVSKYLQPGGAKKESVTLTAATERDVAAREALASALNGASSSKLEAVIAELNKIWELDPGSKVLIFSQYLGFLDIVDGFLTRQGITSFRIDGKMSLKERVTMIDNFNRYTPETRIGTSDGDKRHHGSVFLLSMKAGGVGLNLVAASSVFIIDPWWNAAVEDVSPFYTISSGNYLFLFSHSIFVDLAV